LSTEQEVEIRRRKVQEFLRKGYTRAEIAEKLNVSYQTIVGDALFLNERYKKLVAENPHYLKEQLEKVLRFIDYFDALIKEFWELRERAKEYITVTDKKGNTKKIPLGSIDDQRKLLDSIRSTMVEQAKILKLIGGENKYLQMNYIHIEELNAHITPLIVGMKRLVKEYVPEEKRQGAFQFLADYIKNLGRDKTK